jgi:hypothetical protein
VTQFRGLQFTDFIINRGLKPRDSLFNLLSFSDLSRGEVLQLYYSIGLAVIIRLRSQPFGLLQVCFAYL